MEVIVLLFIMYCIKPKVHFALSMLIELIYTLKVHNEEYDDAKKEADIFRNNALQQLDQTNRWW